MSCRKATALLSASLDRPLTRMEKVQLRVHLVICGACRRYRRQIGAIDRALRRTIGASEPVMADDTFILGDDARDRITRALVEESGDR